MKHPKRIKPKYRPSYNTTSRKGIQDLPHPKHITPINKHLKQTLGTLSGATLGFILGNVPGAILGAKLGHHYSKLGNHYSRYSIKKFKKYVYYPSHK